MRWIWRIIGALVVAAVLLAGALALLPAERLARLAAEQLRAQTGRTLEIGGDVSLSLWPVLGASAEAVTLSNADWAGDAPMMRAERLSIGVDAGALLRGELRVRHIEARRPILSLTRDAQGRGNWEITHGATAAPAGQGDAAPAGRRATLDRLVLEDARIAYAEAGSAPMVLDELDLALDWPGSAGPADLAASIPLGGGAPLSVTGRISDFAGFLGGDSVPLILHAALPGGEASFDGRADIGGSAAGRLTGAAADPARLAAAFGADDPGLDAASLEASLSLDGARVGLRGLDATLGGTRLSGQIDLDLSDKPRFAGRLSSPMLVLPGAQGAGEASGDVRAAEGWSTAAIDASALGRADGTLDFELGGAELGGLTLGATRGRLEIERARAVLTLDEAQAFGGQVAGALVANNRGGLSVRADLTAAAVELGELLRPTGIERLAGPADIRLSLLGEGQSEQAIMSSLAGEGGFTAGPGVISGLDLDRLMRSGAGSGGTTVFDSLTGSFTVAAGVLRNDDLALVLPNYRADGVGTVDLGARTIDYTVTPVALRANAGEGLAIPVHVEGPWHDPRIRPDLEAALRLDLSGKAGEVKADARGKLERKIEEKLDLTRQEGQSLEDAIRDRVEQEAVRGLLKLFGGN